MRSIELLTADLAGLKCRHRLGRVSRLSRGLITIRGLSGIAATGDLIEIAASPPLRAEIIAVNALEIMALADGHTDGIRLETAAKYLGPGHIAPDDSWIGRVIDPFGAALDGLPLTRGRQLRPIRQAAPEAHQRRGLGPRLESGMCLFNTFLPLAQGQRIGLFAGSGVGKSTLLGQFAKYIEADVIVIALIGERGRELGEFIHKILGNEGMKRAVVIAATSDQPAMARRRCILAAMAVAEHFRDTGRQVLFLADSLTRFAEAHREIALAAGESATLRGFPPSTVGAIAGLCERAGPGSGNAGDITGIFTVLVAGSDMEEPVADMVRAVLDGHVVLDRRIAERGRFPAVDLLRAVSRALPEVATPDENALLTRARALLGAYERAELMIQAGLYSSGTDPELDIAIRLWHDLDRFQSSVEPEGISESFQRLAGILRRGGAIT